MVDALTNKGYKVTIYDINPLEDLKKDQEMIVGDILNETDVLNATKGADIVYNFAGIADIEEANNKPIDTLRNNILGNAIILEACRLNKINRFIYASTLYVYSEAGLFYRSSKQACELIIENYNDAFGLPYTILRYGSIYGLCTDERNYVYKILKQAVTEGKVTSYGKADDLREYIHVDDAARYSVDILSKEFENQYVIITGNQPMRRKDLLMMIKEMLGNRIEIEFLPVDSNLHYEITPYSFQPKLAKKFVGKHHIDLGEGLLQCLNEIYKKYYPDGDLNMIYEDGRDK